MKEKKKYKVAVTELLRRIVVVEAGSEAEAHRRASDAWQNGEYLLDSRDFDGAEFHVLCESDGTGGSTLTMWTERTQRWLKMALPDRSKLWKPSDEASFIIAYGNNLVEARMKARCPSAEAFGTSTIYGYRMLFKHSCTGAYYTKRELPIRMTDMNGKHPRDITAMVYVMTEGHDRLRMPMKGYYDLLAEGYERFGFNSHLLELALKEAKEVEEDEIS